MCGIAGFVGHRPARADAVVACIHHRGPDAQADALLTDLPTPVWLAHTRLSIQDLSEAGAQPMRSACGRYCIVFNGEIYNHLDLRDLLPQRAWRGHSDTETLLACIAAWGMKRTLPMLNGMFAFAVVDRQDGTLDLVRDPFGVKPVYYSAGPQLAFASRIDAVQLLTGASPSLDAQALQTFLALRYVPSPHTLVSGVRRLPAGHRLRVDLQSGDHRVDRWVRPTTTRFQGSLSDAVDAYGQLLRRAVERQLLSDVPVGLLLSGGIDSAMVAAIARDLGHRLPAYSVGYGEDSAECELEDAAETARVLGMPFHGIRVGQEDLWTALLASMGEIEEPLGTTSILPMWHLVRRAREDVAVVLTGQGTDEPWGGYRRYQSELIRSRLPAPRLLRPLAAVARLPGVPDGMRRLAMSLPESDTAARFLASYALFTPTERSALTGGAGAPSTESLQDWLAWLAPADLPPAERMMRVDTRMQLADDLLLYGDKNAMAVALEARVPMLDRELVAFVESLPLPMRVRVGRTKVVHRLLAERFVPREIIERPKRGFGVPFRSLCQGPWRRRIEDRLLNGSHLGVLSATAIERVWRDHLDRTDRTRQVFALLALALWEPRSDTAGRLAAK